MITRCFTYFMAAALLSGPNCKGGGKDDGTVDPRDDLRDLCVRNCVKPLCTGNVLPSPDYEPVCESRCEMRVEQAQTGNCISEYETLLTCLDETPCIDYIAWYEELEGAPCSDLEAEVAALCPSIELRDGE